MDDSKRVIAAVNRIRQDRIEQLTEALRRARRYIGYLTFESSTKTELLAHLDDVLRPMEFKE